jgi:hypothetical protein
MNPHTNPKWRALVREAASAAEHMAFGATVLGRASYARPAYYAQAFFALSIGFERSAKLALVVDHALDHGGAYPPSKTLKTDYGHDLKKLLSLTEQIGKRRKVEQTRPSSVIHDGIMETLTDFAKDATRYYNLELVTGSPKAAGRDDPIAAWFERVTKPVLAAHYKDRYRERHERSARFLDDLISDFTLVRFQGEAGEAIRTVYDASSRTAASEFAKRWERMYVLQIARFMAAVLSELGYAAQVQRLADIPYLSDFFRIFGAEDADFRSRKAWSIYPD